MTPPSSCAPLPFSADKKAAKGDKPAKAAKGDKAAKGEKKEKVAKGEKKEKGEKSEKPKKEKAGGDTGAAPAAAAAAPTNGMTASPYGYGGMGGGIFPRVGPFAPSSAAASYFGGGGAIYGAGAGGGPLFGGASGHPYLRATAAGSPLLGLPSARYGPAVTSSGSLLPQQHGGGSTEALLAGLPGSNAVALAQAYQTRMAALSTVAASLLSKREAAVHQLARVQSRMAEVSGAREAIESETLADTEAVLHRLRSAEAQKFASLSKDSESLVSDVGSIDAFYGALTSFQPQFAAGAGAGASATGSADAAALAGLYDPALALQFMRAYPELCAEADRLSVKSIKTDVDVPADDFEREIANRNELASRYAALLDLVAAKDRIILQLLKVRRPRARRCCGATRVRSPLPAHPRSPPVHFRSPQSHPGAGGVRTGKGRVQEWH